MSIFSRSPWHRRAVLLQGRSGHSIRARLALEPLETRSLLSNTISGYVFSDANNNGLLDPGEKPLANIPLELRNSADVVIASTVSDASGFYQFVTDNTISTAPATLQRSASVALTPTDWTKNLSIAQFDPTLGTLTSIDILNAGTITSQIKVENLDSAPATITATVSGSLTLSGVGFNGLITNGASSKTFNATAFDGVLDFDGTSGHDFGPQTATASSPFTITAPSDLAAYLGTGMVTLREVSHATSAASGSGNLVAQISTSAAAQVSVVYHYIPSNALRPGTYKIVETQPPTGFLDGKLSSNGLVIPNSVGQHAITVTLSAADVPNNDFAALVPATLAGYVYLDGNDNGIKEIGEAGLPGTPISLTGSDDLGPVSLTATTAADGSYQFGVLRPGSYTLTEAEPAGYLHGKGSIGWPGGTAVNDHLLAVNLATGLAGTNYNFGELLPSSLNGFVYMDANNNGVRDAGEPALGGVTVTLTGTNAAGPVTLATVTAADGSYGFQNLRPGSYSLLESEPTGYLHGKNALGILGGTVLSDQLMRVNLAMGSAGTDYDFAELTPGSLAGFVYLDANNDGIREAGETGLANVTVTLVGKDDRHAVSLTTTTGSDGSYQFANLRPGSYAIQESEPLGYVHGKNALGTPGGTVLSRQLFAVNLDVGISGQNYDFAHLGLSSLAGFVYLDANHNGMLDPGENGIAGVTVTLVGSNDQGNVNQATITGADGSYQFRNLRPGSYQVLESEPAGYMHGHNTLGWPGGTILSNVDMAVNLDVMMAGTNYNFAELNPPDRQSSSTPTPGMTFGNTFDFPADFTHPLDVTILSKLQFLSFNNTVDSNVVVEATYVDGVYRHVLGRSADAASLVSWVQLLQSGATRAQVVDAVWTSAEHRGLEVERLYETFLQRSADAVGRTAWVNAMLGGASEMDVARALMASPEYQNAHADNAAFVANVYVDVLGRVPSDAEVANWSAALKNGMSRDGLATSVLTSSEDYRLIIDGAYTNLLHRAADPVGEQAWVAALVNGQVTPGQAAESLLASDEFFALARAAGQA